MSENKKREIQHRRQIEKSIIPPGTGINQKLKKVMVLQDLISMSSKVDGVVVECGVAAGWSLGIISQMQAKEVYGFDSFSGFPKRSIHDHEEFDPKKQWRFYEEFDEEFVKQNLINIGVKKDDLDKRIFLKKGFFPNSFKGFNSPVSFLHLDVDLYQSYLHCLEHFYPLMNQYGVCVFDEYDNNNDILKWPGAKRAIDEFSLKNEIEIKKHWTGYSYFIKN
jgi:O-methyltransferase